MKLSVIVPCYNAEAYLEDCLDALLAQSFGDFEAILVDDGSRDGTPEILSRRAARDGRLRVVRQENAGVSAARNRALREASGDWVFFLDADDLLPRDALQCLLTGAGDGTDLVVGLHDTFGEGPTETVYPEGAWWTRAGERRRRLAAARLIEGDSVLNVMCNKLHRRGALLRAGIRLNENLRIAEDALFNLEAVLSAREIAFVPEVTYHYRMHAASATRTQSGPTSAVHGPWLRAMRETLLRRGWMRGFYGNYLDSVVLRYYKDGGVPEVLRAWRGRIRPLLLLPEGAAEELTFGNRALHALVRRSLYPAIYPLLVPLQILGRKLGAAGDLLRRRRIRRGERKDHDGIGE